MYMYCMVYVYVVHIRRTYSTCTCNRVHVYITYSACRYNI